VLWPGQAPSSTPPATQGLGAWGEFAEAHLFLRASCCEHVIEITEWVFAFKAAGETQRRGKKGTHPLFRRRVPTLSVFRQMSWMFDQIEREWFGPGKI